MSEPDELTPEDLGIEKCPDCRLLLRFVYEKKRQARAANSLLWSQTTAALVVGVMVGVTIMLLVCLLG